jgi:hypothetical protein
VAWNPTLTLNSAKAAWFEGSIDSDGELHELHEELELGSELGPEEESVEGVGELVAGEVEGGEIMGLSDRTAVM